MRIRAGRSRRQSLGTILRDEPTAGATLACHIGVGGLAGVQAGEGAPFVAR